MKQLPPKPLDDYSEVMAELEREIRELLRPPPPPKPAPPKQTRVVPKPRRRNGATPRR